MKRTSAQLKQSARMALNGKYGTPMAGFLLLAVIAVSLYMLSTALFGGYSISTMVMEQIFTIVISLILSVFSAGFFKLHLNLCRNQPFRAGDIAYAFPIIRIGSLSLRFCSPFRDSLYRFPCMLP